MATLGGGAQQATAASMTTDGISPSHSSSSGASNKGVAEQPQAPAPTAAADALSASSSSTASSTSSTGSTAATALIGSVKGTVHPACGTYRGASVAEEMNPLRRSTMEDVHRLIPCFDGDHDTSFVGIYDGHGGRDIVDFLATELERNIAQELKVEEEPGADAGEEGQQPSAAAAEGGEGDEGPSTSVPERLCRAYVLTDVQSRQAELMGSGATAVTCLIQKRRRRARKEGEEAGQEEVEVRDIYAANVGDSRAVLCHKGKGVRLTYDHKADDGAEQARIEAAGGFVLRNRVLGILAVTRSFGDHRMKDYVIGVPYTSTTTVADPEETPFLVLACDGVWDVLSDDEAVALVLEEWDKEGCRTDIDAAGLLVREALRRGSTDNITCIVVFL